MSEPIRVLLAENHPLILTGMKAVISDLPSIDLVGTATTIQEIWSICQEGQPNILLLGITTPDLTFVDILAQVQQTCPGVRVLALLSEDKNGCCLQQLSENGAAGGIFKGEFPGALLNAIQTIAQGEPWFSPRLVKRMLQPEYPALTSDELVLLRLMVMGETDRTMSKTMNLSQRTLRRRLKQICEKLGAETRIKVAYLAGQHQLLGEETT